MENKVRKVYIAGHCLNRGSQLQRAEEAEMVRDLGHELYVPQENKEINDKAKAVQEGLAERIVRHDTHKINWCDTIIIEPDSAALGTHVELGQLLGMRDIAGQIKAQIDCFDHFFDDEPIEALVERIYAICVKQMHRQVYPHLEDIRLQAPTGDGQRSTFGVNAYVLGACLKLTDGKGLYSMEEIEKELKHG